MKAFRVFLTPHASIGTRSPFVPESVTKAVRAEVPQEGITAMPTPLDSRTTLTSSSGRHARQRHPCQSQVSDALHLRKPRSILSRDRGVKNRRHRRHLWKSRKEGDAIAPSSSMPVPHLNGTWHLAHRKTPRAQAKRGVSQPVPLPGSTAGVR